MPSAHGPIFCGKELREKVGVKVWFIIRVRQCTRTDFFRRQNIRSTLQFFIGVSFGAHSPIFYWSDCACQWQARSHCWITSLRFFIGLKSAHTIFCRNQLWEKIGLFFYLAKSQHTQTDFHSDFLSSCALDIIDNFVYETELNSTQYCKRKYTVTDSNH